MKTSARAAIPASPTSRLATCDVGGQGHSLSLQGRTAFVIPRMTAVEATTANVTLIPHLALTRLGRRRVGIYVPWVNQDTPFVFASRFMPTALLTPKPLGPTQLDSVEIVYRGPLGVGTVCLAARGWEKSVVELTTSLSRPVINPVTLDAADVVRETIGLRSRNDVIGLIRLLAARDAVACTYAYGSKA